MDRTVAQGIAMDRVSLVRLALREIRRCAQGRSRQGPGAMSSPPDHLRSCPRAPGTGKAIELLQGQILRIEQVEGGQCADFNCFNLHDYKNSCIAAAPARCTGFHPTTGTFMWSAPPRERAMLYILEDTVGRNDVLFPRCSAYVYEAAYGFAVHTNCHDIQAEAQRELRSDAGRRARFLQPVHVHRRRPGRPCLHDPANHRARRPCRPAGADGRARGAQCLRSPTS